MGKVIICREQNARMPFFIRCIGKNVYNMEELCFFFYHELYFVEEFCDWEELAAWLKREMKKDALAKKLQTLSHQYETKVQSARLILEEAGYISEQELDEYQKNLELMHKSSGMMRMKKRADFLVVNHKYHQAIELYLQILNSKTKLEQEFLAAVYHNLGVAYGKMFYFPKAADYFLKAFSELPSRESLKQYKLALRLGEKDEQMDDQILDLPSVQQLDSLLDYEIDAIKEEKNTTLRELETLRQEKQEGKVKAYQVGVSKLLNRWKEECRGYM